MTTPTPPSEYQQGDLVRVDLAVLSGSTPIDPTRLFFTLRLPSGTETTVEYGVGTDIIRDGTGLYHILVDTTAAAGWYEGRWFSTGTGQAAVPWHAFVIAPHTSIVTPAPLAP